LALFKNALDSSEFVFLDAVFETEIEFLIFGNQKVIWIKDKLCHYIKKKTLDS